MPSRHEGIATGLTYAAAGVDTAAAASAVEAIERLAGSTYRPEVLSGIGGFGGAFALGRYREPVLVASTDGVGTKAMVAAAAGRLGTIGVDLVAMCVDDLVCSGAEPLFLLDYLALDRLDPAEVEDVVAGVARGCRAAGCALIGGETAEHPGAGTTLDLAGFAVGVVERERMLGPERVAPGDVIVGLASPGLRCNGYSLARKVLLEVAGRSLEEPAFPGSSQTLADELLRPSVIYAPALLEAASELDLHAAAHITGGGIPGNLSRVLPEGCDAIVRRSSWRPPAIFAEIERLGGIEEREMESVFNLGIGMMVIVAEADAEKAVAVLAGSGQDATVVGEVVGGEGTVLLA
jgi:phosphoribosylformylglycinamidine cyclo-ligase